MFGFLKRRKFKKAVETIVANLPEETVVAIAHQNAQPSRHRKFSIEMDPRQQAMHDYVQAVCKHNADIGVTDGS